MLKKKQIKINNAKYEKKTQKYGESMTVNEVLKLGFANLPKV